MSSIAATTATPTRERSVTSYPARRRFRQGPIDPSAAAIVGVEDAVDIHCHAHDGSQDPLGLMKLASRSGMKAILFKSVVGGREDPAGSVRRLQAQLNGWAAAEGVRPVQCWAGFSVARGYKTEVDPAFVRQRLESGCVAVWLPNITTANTLSVIGGKPAMWGESDDPDFHGDPLPWDKALQIGQYALDDRGKLKPQMDEIIRMAVDHDAALFLGHPSKPELWAMAELCQKLGFTKAVVDHPFSPFVDLTVEECRQAAEAGLWLNFTYDELSPLLGVDPAVMYQAIRTAGPAHCCLSSDAGEPLFPNSVEALRLLRGHMAAFGLTAEELYQVSTTNPMALMPTGEAPAMASAAE
ncbi:MAG: DUF6282 family protein [Alphaproteobacteria bacterium]